MKPAQSVMRGGSSGPPSERLEFQGWGVRDLMRGWREELTRNNTQGEIKVKIHGSCPLVNIQSVTVTNIKNGFT